MTCRALLSEIRVCNENKGKPLTAHDARFTTKDGVILRNPDGLPGEQGVNIKALAQDSPRGMPGQRIASVSLLGSGDQLEWAQAPEGLKAKLPAKAPCHGPVVLKVELATAAQ